MGFPAPTHRAAEAGAEPGTKAIEIDLYYAGGDGFPQLQVEIIGYEVATPPSGRTHLTIPYDPGRPALIIAYLRERVWCDDSLVFGQIDWRPALGVGSIHGFDQESQELEDLGPVWRALKLIRGARVQLGGRLKLEDDPDSGWLKTLEEADRLKAKYPLMQWAHVAARLGIPERTLREYRRRRRLRRSR